MNHVAQIRGWMNAADGQVFAQEQCVVFVDMINSTSLWEKVWKLERHILKYPASFSGVSIKDECWEFVRVIQNEVIEAFVNGGKVSCNFVKGLGDGFIFQSVDILAAYDCARKAEEKVEARLKKLKLPALEKVGMRIAEISPDDTDIRGVSKLCEGLSDALGSLSYRFVIHWTDEVIHGAFYMRNRVTGWLEGKAGLLAVEQTSRRFRNLKIKAPFYPDLFGHDMNYAARCIGVIRENGVYLTQKALDKLNASRRTDMQVRALPLDWKTQIRTKGISGHVAFYKVTYDPNQNATIDHYLTKALVKRAATSDPKQLFETLTELIRGANGSEEYELLRPHLFTALFVTKPENYERVAILEGK